ncbi:hypothetical protein NF27_CG00970 [Candidatus Jidaibacter acanthamoeba]|uniref:Uncharacterized protein n=1 Tax=Candidatus Jidaibacter acanthamoebae TaxID=86105 RepID=A0A0C1MUY0_9RICK|nr:hypothetical protein [Candidatus Jidaibacter acanthamoeba]KIE05917.1 hypothetical protein NF27_CG00970 [Candidatus Jidaibacter acanthamoeba]
MESNLENTIPLENDGWETLIGLNTSASNFLTNYYAIGMLHDVCSQLVGANPRHNYKTQAFVLKKDEKKITTAEFAEKLYDCFNLEHDKEYENLVKSATINTDNKADEQIDILNYLSIFFGFQHANKIINPDPKDDIIDALFLFGNIKDKLKLICKTNEKELLGINSNYCLSVQTGDIMLELNTVLRSMPQNIESNTINNYNLIIELITKLYSVLYDWATSLNVEIPEICNNTFYVDAEESFLTKNADEESTKLIFESKINEIQKCNTEMLLSIVINPENIHYPFANRDCSIIFNNLSFESEGSMFLPEEL